MDRSIWRGCTIFCLLLDRGTREFLGAENLSLIRNHASSDSYKPKGLAPN
jgi:hypothetical protein